MAARNAFRILDHHVTLAPGVEVYVPMRVLASNANSSEVILTLFRQPRMSNADYKRDQTMVSDHAHNAVASVHAFENCGDRLANLVELRPATSLH